VSRVLAVASGKGGAGKTSVAVNLAFALARRGRRVCLLDADLGLSNVDILLGLAPRVTLEHVLFEGASLADALTPAGDGVDVIAGSSGVSRMAELSRPLRARLAEQCASLSGHDYLLVDNSPGISRQVISLCLACSEILVVVNPEAASITDAYALIKVLKENGLARPPLLLLNRAAGEAQAQAVYARMSQAAATHLRLACRYLGQIPRDGAVAGAAARQLPVLTASPASRAARAFMELAARLESPENAAPSKAQSASEFFNRTVARLLEGPLPAAAAPAAGLPGQLKDAALAELATATRLLEMVLEAPEKRLQVGLAELGKRLARATRLLSGNGETRAGQEKSPAAPGAGPGKPAAAKALLVGAAPNLAEVLCEALARANLEVCVPAAGGPVDCTGYAAVVLCRDLRLAAHGDALTERVFERAGAIPVVLVDTGLGGGAPPRERRAAAVVAAPLRLNALVAEVGRLAGRPTGTPRA
jgi:flagellar biosynthesis protein FlhG